MYGTFCSPLDAVNAKKKGYRAAVRLRPSIGELVENRHAIDVAAEVEVVVVDKGRKKAPVSELETSSVDIDFVWRGGADPSSRFASENASSHTESAVRVTCREAGRLYGRNLFYKPL